MSSKSVNILIVSLIFLSSVLSFSFGNIFKAESSEIYVDSSYYGYSNGNATKPYKTIQEAIDVADDGDTIYVFGGYYQETIAINKKVKIVGSIDEIETVIDTPITFNKRHFIEITDDEVTIERVTVSDTGQNMESEIGALICLKSDNNRIIGNYINDTIGYGICIDPNSEDNLIGNNKINNTRKGICIVGSQTNDIANNEILNCYDYGIHIDSSHKNNRLYNNNIDSSSSGIYVQNSDHTNMTNNTIVGSNFYSMYLSDSGYSVITGNQILNSSSYGVYIDSDFCTVSNNTIEDNARGILIKADNNKIYGNNIVEQTASGINIQASGDNNKIYLNVFKNNIKSAQDSGFNNKWYHNYQGNYWSDYNNADKDFDGIGDVVYSKNGVEDKYPLGYFLKPPKKPSNPVPEDWGTDVGLTITLQVHVEDPDSDELTVYFYRGDDDTLIESSTSNPVKNVQNNSNVQCKFKLGFDTTFAWYVVADDGVLQNKSEPFIFSTIATPPDNKPPIADPGGPYFSEENETVQFDSSGSYDPDGEIDFYRWNFGDGSSEIIKENPTHQYLLSEGKSEEYQVTLTVIDNNGSSASGTTFVSVETEENDPPVPKISVKETAYAGENILCDGSNSYDPDDDDLIYNWTFGNGESSSEINPSTSYSTAGNYVITLTVSDGEYSEITSSIINIKEKPDESPGFGVILILLSLVIFILVRKKGQK